MDKKAELEKLYERANSLRALAYNASAMGNAAQFGRLDRELETLYRKINKLQKEVV